MSSSHEYRGTQAFDEADTVFTMPSHPLAGVIRSLVLAAEFAYVMWVLVTGVGGCDAIPAIVRIVPAIVFAAFTRSMVRKAFEEWHVYRRVAVLGPAAERIP